ncbi:MAG: NAD(P)-dependent oxidoreductase [Myxococcota bacterium]
MRITLFGATGALGSECLRQCLDARHEVTVVARTPDKLDRSLRAQIQVIEGDALDAVVVDRALEGAEVALFAIGIDKSSPENLCTDITRHILASMRKHGTRRLVWCGGGSTIVAADEVTFGARFVEFFANTFMGLRHRDKAHQLELLEQNRDLEWIGIRPLQMRTGPRRGHYRVGFDRFSGLSKIHFADCADAMIQMLEDDTWLHQAPIVQY